MAENLNGTGAMPLGLGAAMLKWLGGPDVGQGLGAVLKSSAASSSGWPPSGANMSMTRDQDAGPSGLIQSPDPRLTPENIERFARVLQSECGGTCNPAELQGVGSVIMNRMDHDKTDSVSDATKSGFAVGKDPTGSMEDVARRMLSGQLARNTDATHFYSPRSMPKPGISWKGPSQDTSGGTGAGPWARHIGYGP